MNFKIAFCLILISTLLVPSPNLIAQTISQQNIESILRSDQTRLNTLDEKWRILNDAYYLYKFRIENPINGYEDSSEFRSHYEMAFQELASRALSATEIRLQLRSREIDKMVRAFRANRSNWSNFDRRLSSLRPRYYQYISQRGGIIAIQVRFAALASAIDSEIWRRIAQFTGFFPFC